MRFPSLNSFDKYRARADFRAKNGETDLAEFRIRAKPKIHGVSVDLRCQTDLSGAKEVRTSLRKGDADMRLAAPGFDLVRAEIEQTLWRDRNLAVGTSGIFAEWAGPGIQKGDAVCRIDRPRLFVFGAYFINWMDEKMIAESEGTSDGALRAAAYEKVAVITCPETLAWILNPCEHVEILPWISGSLSSEAGDVRVVEEVMERANELVDRYSVEDSYIMERFGVSAPGEGIVAMPVSVAFNQMNLRQFGELSWKAKTDRHAVKKAARPVVARTEIPADAQEFVETFVTPARIDQILGETFHGEGVGKAGTGRFIAAMLADVMKESVEERAGLDVADQIIERAVRERARDVYLAYCAGKALIGAGPGL